jgi:RNA 2',3'-cyclic 3'-phosphodiesterase
VRLFVALNLPPAIREGIWAATGPVRERDYPLKWVRPEGLHLTLKFLGEVAESRGDAVDRALDQASGEGPPRGIPLAIGDFGAFPDPRRPRVLWVGVAPEPALELLQHRVERAFEAIGFPAEGRPFRPHIALARAGRGKTPPQAGLAEDLAGLRYAESVLVESVEVMQSTLERGGAVYQVRRSVPLV